jgi:Spy/CpxP family protein refolding chaperone
MVTILAAAALLVVPRAATAADLDLPHGEWWKNERVVQRIGLTAEQQGAIGDLVYAHALRMIDLNAELRKAELALAELVRRSPLDPSEVRKAFGVFQTARRRLETERFEMLLAVRQQLTDAQWGELVEIRRQLERLREGWRPETRGPGSRPPGAGGPREPGGGLDR